MSPFSTSSLIHQHACFLLSWPTCVHTMCCEVMQPMTRGTNCCEPELWRVSHWTIIRAQRSTKAGHIYRQEIHSGVRCCRWKQCIFTLWRSRRLCSDVEFDMYKNQCLHWPVCTLCLCSFVYYMDVDSDGKRDSDKLNCEESTIIIWAGSDGLADDSTTLGQEQYANQTTVHFQHIQLQSLSPRRTFNWWRLPACLTGCDNQVYDIYCFIFVEFRSPV